MKNCRSCDFWVGVEEYLDRDDPNVVGQKVQMGQCRRYAPRPSTLEWTAKLEIEPPKTVGVWPAVPSDFLCGEWLKTYN